VEVVGKDSCGLGPPPGGRMGNWNHPGSILEAGIASIIRRPNKPLHGGFAGNDAVSIQTSSE